MFEENHALKTLIFLQPISHNLLPQVTAYRYMFEGEHEGLDVPLGWHAPFALLCDAIDDFLGPDRRGFRWTRLREKLGSPRWEWELGGERDRVTEFLIPPNEHLQSLDQPQTLYRVYQNVDTEMHNRIRRLVNSAMLACATRCMECGCLAEQSRSENGWYRTLCGEHVQEAA